MLEGNIQALMSYHTTSILNQNTNILNLVQQMSNLDKSPARDQSISRTKPVFVMPFEQDYDFVGREEILEDLRLKLNSKHRRVALAGIGGVG